MSTDRPQPSLEFYRKQARELLRSARSGDAAALQRISAHTIPSRISHITADGVALNDAQRCIAREMGYRTWGRFKEYIVTGDGEAVEAAFVRAALNGTIEADRILAEHPAVAQGRLAPALVLGDESQVRELLPLTRESLALPVGPESWQPILYVCFSHYASRNSARSAQLAALCRLLLSHGADPNAGYTPPDWPDSVLTCLYGATGLNNNLDMANALMDAGAVLDDTESLYHSTEHADKECMRLLLRRGADPNSLNVMFHLLDGEDLDGLRVLLDAGADLSILHTTRRESPLHWAVWRGRSAGIIRELATRGAEIDAKRDDGRTAYAMAYRSGQTETAELLRSLGADTTLEPMDRVVGDLSTAAGAELMTLAARFAELRTAPGAERALPDLAIRRRTGAVKALLQVGADVNAVGEAGATALHWACWYGYADLASLLIGAGASLTAQDAEFHATPGGWFEHGVRFCPDRTGDWTGTARALLAAAVQLFPGGKLTGIPELDDLLQAEREKAA